MDQLSEALDDRKQFEIELISVKRNFINAKKELEIEKAKTEQLGVEMINLVNENKAV
jgi:hypothetical protein